MFGLLCYPRLKERPIAELDTGEVHYSRPLPYTSVQLMVVVVAVEVGIPGMHYTETAQEAARARELPLGLECSQVVGSG